MSAHQSGTLLELSVLEEAAGYFKHAAWYRHVLLAKALVPFSELLYEQYDCVAVFLEPQLQSRFYHGFCRGYLRPIFRNQLVCPTEKDPYSLISDKCDGFCDGTSI